MLILSNNQSKCVYWKLYYSGKLSLILRHLKFVFDTYIQFDSVWFSTQIVICRSIFLIFRKACFRVEPYVTPWDPTVKSWKHNYLVICFKELHISNFCLFFFFWGGVTLNLMVKGQIRSLLIPIAFDLNGWSNQVTARIEASHVAFFIIILFMYCMFWKIICIM